MTSKTKISMMAIMAVAATLLIPASGMATAQQPIELSEEMKTQISKMPTERQSHMEQIFKLLIEKERSDDASDKERLDGLIQAEYAQMSISEEQARPQYDDHSQLRTIQQDVKNLEELPLVTTLVGKNKLTVVLQPGSESEGWEDKILQNVSNKALDIEIKYGEITATE